MCGRPGEHGGISVSFPSLAESGGSGAGHSSSAADVEAVAYTTGLSQVAFHQPGATIYHRDDNRQFDAEYLLVESDDATWPSRADRTLELRITPKGAGEFPVQIRGWLCAEDYTDCSRQPEAGSAEDQQGWGVERVTVAVTTSPSTATQTQAPPTEPLQVDSGHLVQESFASPLDTDRWFLFGSAKHFQPEGVIELTAARTDQLGILLDQHPVSAGGFHIKFSFEIKGGSGADGLGFVLLR